MSKRIDMAGMRYGMLTVVKEHSQYQTNCGCTKTRWECVCDCGATKVIEGSLMRAGQTRSCGCLRKKVVSEQNTKHGLSNSRVYNIWRTMKARCIRKTCDRYKWYGGVGVSVCDEWGEFSAFYKWAIENGYGESLSIDRINLNVGYSPENCRWVDMKTQANNKSNNRRITYNGETHTLSEWAKITKINYSVMRSRVRSGMPPDKIFANRDLRRKTT